MYLRNILLLLSAILAEKNYSATGVTSLGLGAIALS